MCASGYAYNDGVMGDWPSMEEGQVIRVDVGLGLVVVVRPEVELRQGWADRPQSPVNSLCVRNFGHMRVKAVY
jgi:hypothetical protein